MLADRPRGATMCSPWCAPGPTSCCWANGRASALLVQQPAHGYDIATRLAPAGDIGRVWSLSRPLTYRVPRPADPARADRPGGGGEGQGGGQSHDPRPDSSGPKARAPMARRAGPPLPSRSRRASPQAGARGVARRRPDEAAAVTARPVRADGRRTRSVGRSRKATADPVAVWRYESSRAALRFIDRMIAAPRR